MAPPPVSGPRGAAWLLLNTQSMTTRFPSRIHSAPPCPSFHPCEQAPGAVGIASVGVALPFTSVRCCNVTTVSSAWKFALWKLRICTAFPPSSVTLFPPSMTVLTLMGRFSVAVTAMRDGRRAAVERDDAALRDRRLQRAERAAGRRCRCRRPSSASRCPPRDRWRAGRVLHDPFGFPACPAVPPVRRRSCRPCRGLPPVPCAPRPPVGAAVAGRAARARRATRGVCAAVAGRAAGRANAARADRATAGPGAAGPGCPAGAGSARRAAVPAGGRRRRRSRCHRTRRWSHIRPRAKQPSKPS